MTFNEAFYRGIIADTATLTAIGTLHNIKAPSNVSGDYYVIQHIDDPENSANGYLCNTDMGIARFQFDFFTDDQQASLSNMETLRAFVLDMYGVYNGYTIQRVDVSGFRHLGDPDTDIYHWSFDALVDYFI